MMKTSEWVCLILSCFMVFFYSTSPGNAAQVAPTTGAIKTFNMVQPKTTPAKMGVQFKTAKGYYMVAVGGGGGQLNGNSKVAQKWETFELIDLNGGVLESGDTIQIGTYDKKHYLGAPKGGGSDLLANETTPGNWETFTILKKQPGPIRYGDSIYLKTYKGQYVVAENGGGKGVKANQSKTGSWTTFVMISPYIQMMTGAVKTTPQAQPAANPNLPNFSVITGAVKTTPQQQRATKPGAATPKLPPVGVIMGAAKTTPQTQPAAKPGAENSELPKFTMIKDVDQKVLTQKIQASTSSALLSMIQNGTGMAIDAESDGAISIRSKSGGTNGAGVAGYCYASGGSGVFGQGDSKGVWGTSGGSTGYGVYGEATKTGPYGNYGGYFVANGDFGKGVYGKATDASHTNSGGYFESAGVTGRGVYGEASGAQGRGVYGQATNEGDVENYGGYFVAKGSNGRGVYAEAPDTGYAGYFNGRLYASNGIQFPDGTVLATAPARNWYQRLPASERFVRVMNQEAILDKETGLVWEQAPDTTEKKWADAVYYCRSKVVGNRLGWRLPTIEELSSLVDKDKNQTGRALPAGSSFSNVVLSAYWSSTIFEFDPRFAYFVDFPKGKVDGGPIKDFEIGVWCVRGGR